MAAAAKNVIQLRQLLAEQFPNSQVTLDAEPVVPERCCSSGVPKVDELLGGGFPRGITTELVVPRQSSGSALILHSLLRQAHYSSQWLALIDGADSFDPTAFENSTLAHLLWVRCHSASEALQSADLLLRDGNLPMVLLDLRMNLPGQLRKVSSSCWYRFQRIIEETSASFVVITPAAMAASAHARLFFQGSFALDALGRREEELLTELQFQVEYRRGQGKGVSENNDLRRLNVSGATSG